MGGNPLRVYTTEEALEKFNDDLPRFMVSSPTVIHRKYGLVNVTQEDVDRTSKEVENNP